MASSGPSEENVPDQPDEAKSCEIIPRITFGGDVARKWQCNWRNGWQPRASQQSPQLLVQYAINVLLAGGRVLGPQCLFCNSFYLPSIVRVQLERASVHSPQEAKPAKTSDGTNKEEIASGLAKPNRLARPGLAQRQTCTPSKCTFSYFT